VAKAKKHRTKKPTKCPCLKGWVCEDHPNSRGVTEVAGALVSYATIRSATKIPILFLFWDSPAKENRQSEKLHSALEVWRKAGGRNRVGRRRALPAALDNAGRPEPLRNQP